MLHLKETRNIQQGSAQPLIALERIEVVDILRGMALGGILIANMADFTSPFYYIPLSTLWPETHNLVVLAFIQIFVTGNFFTIFSFLFGLGLALQMIRLEARGVQFIPIYLRRQSILFSIGIIQGLLIWYGDILAPYALFGCLLLFFRHWPPWKLVIVSVGLILTPIAISIVRMVMAPEIFTLTSNIGNIDPSVRAAAQRVIEVYARGNWVEIFHQRIGELITNYSSWIGRNYGATVFSMFLLGLSAGRSNIFNNLEQYIPLIQKMWYIGLAFLCISITGTIESYLSYAGSSIIDLVFYQYIKVAHIFICLFYIASVILLARKKRWKYFMSFFAAPGRMALTNYLVQSIIFTTIFNSYGLGLFGAISPLTGLILSILFYAGQVVVSNWFLTRFQFGPAEWIWKSLTYGKRQPFILHHR